MKIEIYEEDKLVDRNNIYTNFKEKIEIQKYVIQNIELDFSSIHSLKGNKELLHKSFRHELTENTLD